jgi:hypothetical protein
VQSAGVKREAVAPIRTHQRNEIILALETVRSCGGSLPTRRTSSGHTVPADVVMPDMSCKKLAVRQCAAAPARK